METLLNLIYHGETSFTPELFCRIFVFMLMLECVSLFCAYLGGFKK